MLLGRERSYVYSFECGDEMNITPGVTMRNRLCDHCINKQTLVNIVK